MSKHSLSPASLPPSKRLHTIGADGRTQDPQPQSIFDELFDELILFIFSYLSHTDLCNVQRTNRNWSRLSLDNQLWKTLYINEYGRMRLRGARGFIGRGDGREVKSLPGRAKAEDVRDWKWMFRISSNWRTGRCTVEQFDVGPSAGLLTQAAEPDETRLLLTGNVAIAASSRPSSVASLWLSCPAHTPCTLPCPSSRSNTARITALAMDQSPPASAHHGRLACFLSTGEFTLFSIDHQTPSASSRLLTYHPSSRSSRTAPIVQAVYHHPLLVTLSESFRLSLYHIGHDTVSHTQTLSSFTSYPPSSPVLSCLSPTTYKLILAYAIPVYPAHWTVGATELIISNSETESMVVTNTRTTRAIDVPPGWVDENKMRTVREQWGRKVARVADTQTDGKWVVLAPGQKLPGVLPDSSAGQPAPSQPSSSSGPSSPSSSGTAYTSSSMYTASGLQLYRLHLPSSASSSSSPKLTFVRTLHGQIGPVSTLALSDGRCVSLGVNGSIWVWDLEGGTGTEVSAGVTEAGRVRMRLARGARGAVVFDDRRIVSSCGSGVEIRRFDV
ncbi:hypothetical protein DICSQDRAFT_87930 [Dichomitus squalens LYAD-421 SS1]|uniref:F-box domain-containing protein n=1 Tax=Dichomitus squalens (strain LYAD-421) TaxID=732165 RepID=R7SWG4_DICSQ|nr:uncharacterized protein DICSQDRAFT_87930 [Dichomitus squalens LYAD-421 SS1]EJF60421.1 hypothetical protein DICSQDRAFT_87930 [Dichomitus squalens LYAD-421 SS1]